MNFKINHNEIQDILPLTHIQKQMLFFHIADNTSHTYYEQQTYMLQGEIYEDLIRQTWLHLLSVNETLRSVIIWRNIEHPVHVIFKNIEFPYQVVDLSKENNSFEAANLMIDKEWECKIDIQKNSYRIMLCKMSQRKYLMILSTHHIFTDGWSNMILLNEFYTTYHQLYYEKPLNDSNKAPLKQYIQFVNQNTKIKVINFWKHYLKGYCEKKSITGMYALYKSEVLSYKLNKIMMNQLNEFVLKHNITTAILFYAAWGYLQMKMQKVCDTVFGIIVSGREASFKGIEDLVGLFIKSLPIRVQWKEHDTAIQFMERIRSDFLAIESNQQINFAEVMTDLGLNSMNLFNTAVVIQKYTLNKSQLENRKEQVKLKLYNSKYETNLDITVGIKDLPDEFIEIEFSYNKLKYSHEDINIISKEFVTIINCWINTENLNNLII